MQKIKATQSMVRVLGYLLDHEGEEIYGYRLVKVANVETQTGYSILHKLESYGWLKSHWEKPHQGNSEQRPRRYYKITRKGSQEAKKILQAWSGETQSLLDSLARLIKPTDVEDKQIVG